jgi:hypothetical protein
MILAGRGKGEVQTSVVTGFNRAYIYVHYYTHSLAR